MTSRYSGQLRKAIVEKGRKHLNRQKKIAHPVSRLVQEEAGIHVSISPDLSEAARRSGLNRGYVYRKLKEHGLGKDGR